MKNPLMISVLLFFLAACTEVYFTESQPAGKKALKQIPDDFHGFYLDPDSNDTIQINAASFEISNDEGYLSDSIELKKWKKYYFLNIKEDQHGYWDVYLIRFADNKTLEVSMIDGDDSVAINMLKTVTEVTVKEKSDGKVDYYLIEPSRKELLYMIDKGVFSSKTKYSRID